MWSPPCWIAIDVEDPLAYDAQAEDLVRRFNVNFEQFASGVTEAVREAAPASTAVVS